MIRVKFLLKTSWIHVGRSAFFDRQGENLKRYGGTFPREFF